MPYQMVFMATKIMWYVNYIIVDQNTNYEVKLMKLSEVALFRNSFSKTLTHQVLCNITLCELLFWLACIHTNEYFYWRKWAHQLIEWMHANLNCSKKTCCQYIALFMYCVLNRESHLSYQFICLQLKLHIDLEAVSQSSVSNKTGGTELLEELCLI